MNENSFRMYTCFAGVNLNVEIFFQPVYTYRWLPGENKTNSSIGIIGRKHRLTSFTT